MTSTLFIRYPELATKSERKEIVAEKREFKEKYEELKKANPDKKIILDPFVGWIVK